MEKTKLDEMWKEHAADTFKQFVTKEIGWDEKGRPKCFGTGDAQSYCPLCIYKTQC